MKRSLPSRACVVVGVFPPTPPSADPLGRLDEPNLGWKGWGDTPLLKRVF